MENENDLIERYLDGSLSKSEVEEFESRVKRDRDLEKSLSLAMLGRMRTQRRNKLKQEKLDSKFGKEYGKGLTSKNWLSRLKNLISNN